MVGPHETGLLKGIEEMNDLQLGDQIEIVFADAPGHSVRGRVARLLSDQQEGLSSEAEDYVSCWLEISPEDQGTLSQTQTITLTFGVDWKYYMDGREVKIRKCSKLATTNVRSRS